MSKHHRFRCYCSETSYVFTWITLKHILVCRDSLPGFLLKNPRYSCRTIAKPCSKLVCVGIARYHVSTGLHDIKWEQALVQSAVASGAQSALPMARTMSPSSCLRVYLHMPRALWTSTGLGSKPKRTIIPCRLLTLFKVLFSLRNLHGSQEGPYKNCGLGFRVLPRICLQGNHSHCNQIMGLHNKSGQLNTTCLDRKPRDI